MTTTQPRMHALGFDERCPTCMAPTPDNIPPAASPDELQDRRWSDWRATVAPTGYGGFGVWWENAPAMEGRGGYSGPSKTRDEALDVIASWVLHWSMTPADITVTQTDDPGSPMTWQHSSKASHTRVVHAVANRFGGYTARCSCGWSCGPRDDIAGAEVAHNGHVERVTRRGQELPDETR